MRLRLPALPTPNEVTSNHVGSIQISRSNKMNAHGTTWDNQSNKLTDITSNHNHIKSNISKSIEILRIKINPIKANQIKANPSCSMCR